MYIETEQIMTTTEYRNLPKQSLLAKDLKVGMFLATAYNFTEISEVKVMPKTVKVGYKISTGKTLYWHFKSNHPVQIENNSTFDSKKFLVEYVKENGLWPLDKF